MERETMTTLETKAVASGNKDFGDGAGIQWFLFASSCINLADLREIVRDELEAYYGGPGRPFARRPHVKQLNSRILVTQSYGLDI